MRYLIILAGLFPGFVFADSISHLDPVSPIILWVTLIFFFGILGRYIAKKMNLPGVLGELLMGVLVGNVGYFFDAQLAIILREGPAIFNIMTSMFSGTPLAEAARATILQEQYAAQIIKALSGVNGPDLFKIAYIVDVFSRYGVIFLLFMVGLESSLSELKQTGRESIQVAVIGVVAPILLGLGVTYFLMPQSSFQADLFIAATLSATSIGITARVLKDMNKLATREAKTILGAAMIDDILGLIILAVVSNLVMRGGVDCLVIGRVILYAGVFFIAALWIGPLILRKTVSFLSSFELWEAKLFTAFLFLMCLAWLASFVQLASIVGAFVAGVIIHDNMFKSRGETKAVTIQSLVAPIEAVFAPLFFMLIGIQVKLESFVNAHVLWVATGLILAAILGKVISGLGANRKDDRLLIGIGMLPRGEVGLVFASIGRTIGVISDELFAAIILMVIVTTFIAPPLIKIRFSKPLIGKT